MNEFIGKWRNFITDSNRISENYEIGDEVILRGGNTVTDTFTVVAKRRMFGSDLMAYSVEHPNGETMEYDETQLSAVPTIMGDRAARSAQFNDGNEFEDEHLDTDDVLDGVIDEELFTPNEMSAKSVEDENLAEGKELDVIETDNRDSKYTILRLSNGDYVEVNVIELYQNLIDNQSDDENLAEIKSLNESAPGYNTRKFGHPLPTLESIQAAHEAKEEPRDGVQSAAEKLGMKPSHVKEDSSSGAEIDPNVLMSGEPYKNDYANSEEDYTDSMVIEKIKDIIRYHELDPSDVLEEIGQEFGIAFEFGRG